MDPFALLDDCASALTTHARAHSGPSAERVTFGAQRFFDAVAASRTLAPPAYEAALLPALDGRHVVGTASTDLSLAGAIAAAAPSLPWVPTMRSNNGGAEIALCPLGAVAELGRLSLSTAEGDGIEAGFMYVDAGCRYPEHHHRPQEIYLVISGTGQWRYGGSARYVDVSPGATFYNHPDDVHGMVAGDTPVLAMYVLWSD
ncbi:MAG: quercetin dioxygenase-like cupin family protein [Candidatus Poriferisodalaceae bacterium]|jgi:quercetin dioxygenase-like cupin family protein